MWIVTLPRGLGSIKQLEWITMRHKYSIFICDIQSRLLFLTLLPERNLYPTLSGLCPEIERKTKKNFKMAGVGAGELPLDASGINQE